MSETKLPGLSAAMVEESDVIWAKAFGFRDLEHGLAATPHTLYGIGSVTKSFTALSIMQLAEQGKLSLDDPVDAYVPINIRPGGESIRISHLMSHSSDIPALAYDAEAVIRGATGAGENWFPIANCSDLLTFMADAQDWTLTCPGERWFYLNEGYAILGYIIEKCSGMPYEEYVQKYVLTPLGMKRSFFSKEEVGKDPEELPFVRRERALTDLVGTYETYKGTMKAQVKRMGDFLTIEIKDKYKDLIVPLVPEAIEGDTRIFFTLASATKLPVEFRVDEVGIDLIYERYRLRKTGKLL